MFQWIEDHPALLTWLTVASVVMFIATLFVVPVIIARLPADHFRRHLRSDRLPLRQRYSGPMIYWLVVKNILGALFLIAGIAMLVLPGQGVITILIGLTLLNFPGKHRMERALVRRPRILRSLNWMRRKCNQDEFIVDARAPARRTGGDDDSLRAEVSPKPVVPPSRETSNPAATQGP